MGWLSLLILFAHKASYAAEFDVLGLDDELTDNVEYYLTPLADVPATQLSKNKLTSLVNDALNPYGYYHPQLQLDIKDSKSAKLHIDSGPVVIIARSNIAISGEAATDPDFTLLLEETPLASGAPLRHAEYDHLKQGILSLAQKKGYLDGKFTASTIEVIPSQNRANIDLQFVSGPRYKFGVLSVPDDGVDPKRIEQIATFKRGEGFDTIKLGEFQARLSETGWFKSVYVKGDFNETGEEDREIPIELIAEPSSKNIVQVGGGYSTDLGLRASLNWTKPWYNRQGHSSEAQAYLSEQEQSLLLSYKIPTQQVTTDYYGVQFESKHTDYRDTQSFSNDLTFERYWQLDSAWQSSVYLKYLREQYKQASEEQLSQLLLPGISFSQVDRKNDRLEVKHRHMYSLEVSNSHLFSDSNILRIEGNSVLSWDISDSQKLHFRSNVGINFADSLSDVPSSLRYFAGGDGSLRGYDYESISPKDENGELTGGRYLLTAGLEYQHQVYRSIWMGIFFDAGDAFDEYIDVKRGTGVSLIWNSTFMPVKLDFAYGLDAPKGDEFRIHFSLGAQF
ncbi:autotransporter assembly complex family protein [uncultured Vibrio sp.]|uniref:autotransporter assembly complex protein TamA n=1 Tax=uncultured Vibrio sp. TaxID=114054 RepID=UPI0026089A1F|nr:autotransporter assembly complex family protein [uncultured Vibrio sp.]